MHLKQIIRESMARLQGKVPNREARTGEQVNITRVPDLPSGLPEHPVDVFPGLIFWSHWGLSKNQRNQKCGRAVPGCWSMR